VEALPAVYAPDVQVSYNVANAVFEVKLATRPFGEAALLAQTNELCNSLTASQNGVVSGIALQSYTPASTGV
jgi:hypothetical protein